MPGTPTESGGLMKHHATFRFYADLNDFLPPAHRGVAWEYGFKGRPSIKDAIEAIGIPHPEIELILVDGSAVDFNFTLDDGQHIAVFPRFGRLELVGLPVLRLAMNLPARFVLDVHLGRLASYLRLLGFDSLYSNQAGDEELARHSAEENRLLLTRDQGLLKRGKVGYGYWVRALKPRNQLLEVVARLRLGGQLRPFSRCMTCNGVLAPVAKAEIAARLPGNVRKEKTRFSQCMSCGHLYWQGSHYDRLAAIVRQALASGNGRPSTPGT
jgi:uncharacterized protein with PIN domain